MLNPSTILLDGVSVVLPAHNEEENLAKPSARRCGRRAGEPAPGDHRRRRRVARRDGRALPSALAALDSRVRLVRHEHNRGYGCAIRSGIAAARMEWVLLTDADLQFDLGQLTEFVPHTADAQLVVGYRASAAIR